MRRRITHTAIVEQRAELVRRKKKKNPPINYTEKELAELSEDKFTFLSLILANKWMEAIYIGVPEYDRKLHFIRAWYNARSNKDKPGHKPAGPVQETLF